MSVKGVIDSVHVSGTQIILSGWVYDEIEGVKKPVTTIGVEGASAVGTEFYYRSDFESGNQYGVRFLLGSVDDLVAIAFSAGYCFAEAQGIKNKIDIWGNINRKVFDVILGVKLKSYHIKDRIKSVEIALASVRDNSYEFNDNYSTIDLEVGFLNYDRSVVVGRDGYLFLEGGSNNLSDAYVGGADKQILDSWISLLNSREYNLRQRGIDFIQLIIPEKQSVLGSFYPRLINSPTALYQEISSAFRAEKHYLDAFFSLSSACNSDRTIPYRRLDSHLSFHGVRLVIEKLTESISGREFGLPLPALDGRRMAGDLGNKFGFGNMVETTPYPLMDEWPLAGQVPKLVYAFDPDTGHRGTVRHWHSSSPQVDKRVMVFGNSIFERGGDPLTLSWWASRIFRETVFVWSPDLEFDFIEKMNPDVVVAQTVERFLKVVPNF